MKGELLSRLQQPDCDTETAALLVQICCALGGDGWAEPLRHDPALGGKGLQPQALARTLVTSL